MNLNTIIPYGIEFAACAVIVFITLALLVKLQRLELNLLPLFGSSLLASGLGLIPYAGHYIAVVVLWFCLAKAIKVDLFPVAIVTGVIAYAVMFSANVFFIGVLLSDLRLSAPKASASEHAGGEKGKRSTTPRPTPHDTPSAQSPAKKLIPETSPSPAEDGMIRPRKPAGPTSYNSIRLQGFSGTPNRRMALLGSGTRSFAMAKGEEEFIPTSTGRIRVRIEEFGTNSVRILVGTKDVELFIE